MKQLLLSIVRFMLGNGFKQIFLRNSKTTIWQLASALRYETVMNFYFHIRTATSLCASYRFMNAFETGDQRKVNWTKSVTTGLNTWNHPNKYKLRTQQQVRRNILLCCA
jgi:hypothetical protein